MRSWKRLKKVGEEKYVTEIRGVHSTRQPGPTQPEL